MQKKQSKNSRKSIDGTQKTWHSKSVKKKRSNRENFQGGLRRRNYTDGQTNNTTRNIGVGWRETGDDRRAGDP